jgi:hypothetical protein
MFCLTATSVAGAITFKMNHEGNSVACREERKFLMDWDAELHTAAQLAAYEPFAGLTQPTTTPTPAMTAGGRDYQG